jgi:hypothetical protein
MGAGVFRWDILGACGVGPRGDGGVAERVPLPPRSGEAPALARRLKPRLKTRCPPRVTRHRTQGGRRRSRGRCPVAGCRYRHRRPTDRYGPHARRNAPRARRAARGAARAVPRPRHRRGVEAVPLPAGSEFNRPRPKRRRCCPDGRDATVRSPRGPEASVPMRPGGWRPPPRRSRGSPRARGVAPAAPFDAARWPCPKATARHAAAPAATAAAGAA